MTSQQIDLSGKPFYRMIYDIISQYIEAILLIKKSLNLSLKFWFLIRKNDLSAFLSESLLIIPLLLIQTVATFQAIERLFATPQTRMALLGSIE